MSTKRIAICPGSYDPITIGHADIIIRSASLFDEVIVALGENSTKKYLFDFQKRMDLIKATFASNENIKVVSYSGLTIDYCVQNQINWIVRGIRNSIDYEYEKAIAATNQQLAPSVETVFLNANPALANISSTIIREIYLNGGKVSSFIPVPL
jgi:pantetheine-phosphate adenylyltransferase